MNVPKVIEKLKAEYPGKNIILNPQDNPTEIICEVNPAQGLAIAVIDRSVPHHHDKTTEEYRVIEGLLTLYINGNEKELTEGEEFEVYPGEVHFAIGEETWVEVRTTPPWASVDHILEEKCS